MVMKKLMFSLRKILKFKNIEVEVYDPTRRCAWCGQQSVDIFFYTDRRITDNPYDFNVFRRKCNCGNVWFERATRKQENKLIEIFEPQTLQQKMEKKTGKEKISKLYKHILNANPAARDLDYVFKIQKTMDLKDLSKAEKEKLNEMWKRYK